MCSCKNVKVIKCNVVKVVGNQIINLAKGPHVLIGLQMAIPLHDGSCEILYGIILAHRLKNKILKKKYKALRPLLLMQPMQNMQEEY